MDIINRQGDNLQDPLKLKKFQEQFDELAREHKFYHKDVNQEDVLEMQKVFFVNLQQAIAKRLPINEFKDLPQDFLEAQYHQYTVIQIKDNKDEKQEGEKQEYKKQEDEKNMKFEKWRQELNDDQKESFIKDYAKLIDQASYYTAMILGDVEFDGKGQEQNYVDFCNALVKTQYVNAFAQKDVEPLNQRQFAVLSRAVKEKFKEGDKRGKGDNKKEEEVEKNEGEKKGAEKREVEEKGVEEKGEGVNEVNGEKMEENAIINNNISVSAGLLGFFLDHRAHMKKSPVLVGTQSLHAYNAMDNVAVPQYLIPIPAFVKSKNGGHLGYSDSLKKIIFPGIQMLREIGLGDDHKSLPMHISIFAHGTTNKEMDLGLKLYSTNSIGFFDSNVKHQKQESKLRFRNIPEEEKNEISNSFLDFLKQIPENFVQKDQDMILDLQVCYSQNAIDNIEKRLKPEEKKKQLSKKEKQKAVEQKNEVVGFQEALCNIVKPGGRLIVNSYVDSHSRLNNIFHLKRVLSVMQEVSNNDPLPSEGFAKLLKGYLKEGILCNAISLTQNNNVPNVGKLLLRGEEGQVLGEEGQVLGEDGQELVVQNNGAYDYIVQSFKKIDDFMSDHVQKEKQPWNQGGGQSWQLQGYPEKQQGGKVPEVQQQQPEKHKKHNANVEVKNTGKNQQKNKKQPRNKGGGQRLQLQGYPEKQQGGKVLEVQQHQEEECYLKIVGGLVMNVKSIIQAQKSITKQSEGERNKSDKEKLKNLKDKLSTRIKYAKNFISGLKKMGYCKSVHQHESWKKPEDLKLDQVDDFLTAIAGVRELQSVEVKNAQNVQK